MTAGAGEGDDEFKYLVHPKLFYYSPEYSINIITDFNNIGEVPFTFRDYFNFTGRIQKLQPGRWNTHSISARETLGFAVAQNNRANDLETQFLAGNFSWRAGKNWDLSGFGILSDNKTNIVNNSIRQYINTGVTERTQSMNDQRNQLAMMKLSSVYKPSTDFQLDYDVLVKGSKQTEDANTLSQFSDNNNDIDEVKENKPYSINQNANAYYTLDDKNIFAGQIQHLWQDEDPFYNAVTDLIPFAGILPVDTTQNRYSINQQKNVRTNKVDAKVDYFYVLNNTSNLNFTLGTTYSNQQFDSNMFQLLGSGTELDLIQTPEIDGERLPLSNDVTYAFTDLFLGLRYKIKLGEFILTPGLTLHNYNLKDEQLGTTMTQNDWLVLPDFNAIWNIKKSESLRFNYGITAEYTDVNNYAAAFVFNNYNSMFRGNRNLENSMSHVYSLNYFQF